MYSIHIKTHLLLWKCSFDGQNKRKQLHMVAAFMELAFEQLWLLILLTLQQEGV
jgi:hypothetical protein